MRNWKAIAFGTLVVGCWALPQAVAPLLQKGRDAFRERNWADAERLFIAAIRSAPDSVAPYKWLGMTYAAQEKYALAEQPLRRACEIDP